MADKLRVKFWGVRGSTPTPIAENLGFGGNTTCLEVRGPHNELIIIDAGSGIRSLGKTLAAENAPQRLNVFLTHFHWDHLQGLPFFDPLLKKGNTVVFHSFPPVDETRQRLELQMSNPYFTLDFNSVGARREYQQTAEPFQSGSLSVTTFPLNHPQRAFGYRIEAEGHSIVFASDMEHGDSDLDQTLLEHSAGADLLIYDAQYTPAEYQNRQGWGHSTYDAAATFANVARVKKLILFHHDPTHDDAAIRQIVSQASVIFPNTVAAQELITFSV